MSNNYIQLTVSCNGDDYWTILGLVAEEEDAEGNDICILGSHNGIETDDLDNWIVPCTETYIDIPMFLLPLFQSRLAEALPNSKITAIE